MCMAPGLSGWTLRIFVSDDTAFLTILTTRRFLIYVNIAHNRARIHPYTAHNPLLSPVRFMVLPKMINRRTRAADNTTRVRRTLSEVYPCLRSPLPPTASNTIMLNPTSNQSPRKRRGLFNSLSPKQPLPNTPSSFSPSPSTQYASL